MSLDCKRFASPSPLPWINLMGASSIAIFWTLVGINIKPVQANSPEPQVTPTAVPATAGLTIPPATNSQELQQALAKQALPAAEEITQPSITKASVLPPQTAALAVKPEAAVERVAEVGQAVTEDKAQEELERSLVAKPNHCADKTCSHWMPSATAVRSPSANPKLAQLPYPTPTSNPLPVPAAPIPGGFGSSNSTFGQLPSLPQPQSAVPVPPPALPGGFNNYPQMGGQQAYYPQMMMLVPVPQQGMAPPPNGYPQMGQPAYYPQMGGQQAYYPQMMMLIPVPPQGMAPPPNGYPQMGQPTYYPQAVQPLPPPLAPNQPSFNGYPQMGQPAYYPQVIPVAPNQPSFNGYPQRIGQSPYYQQAVPVAPNQPSFNGYPQVGQSPYYQQAIPVAPNQPSFNGYPPMGQPTYYPQAIPVAPNQPSFNGYPQVGQPAYYPQAVPIAPNQPGFNNYPQIGQSPYYQQAIPVAPNQPGFNNYPQVGQSPYYPQALPLSPNPNLAPPASTPTAAPLNQQQPLLRSTALTSPVLQLQGTYINQGDQSSARARLAALYPLTPQVQFGATLDLTSEANSFADSRGQGLNVNELYIATAPFTGLPNLRFVAGQLDLTSYFDRNSFAKDGASQFFNPVFQTNPALSATGIASRPGVLVNWTLTDNIEAKAAVFSSSRSLSDFSLDAFAGEIGFRYGNAIVRGTFTSDRDAGSRDGFREIFGATRPDGSTGIRSSDREDAYGVNGEYFFPNLNMGLFARYGRYENQALKRGGDTYSFGVSFLDVMTKDDRLGLAYGRNLSNDLLRSLSKADVPDVLELFYDFRFLPNLRLGFTLQQRNGFEDTYAGFRVRSDFDVTPRGRLTP
ncbi:MAG TPA: hypothetical protein V6D37_09460 [Candidatus Sericytochromatia bacterium]